MGITITEVKVVGCCSKHRNKEIPTPRYKDGTLVSDNDIACIECEF